MTLISSKHPQDSCRELNLAWSGMATTAEFPVAPGTLVTVTCNTGYQLTGEDVLTCVKDTEFQHSGDILPVCVIGRAYLVSQSHYVSLHFHYISLYFYYINSLYFYYISLHFTPFHYISLYFTIFHYFN